MSINPILHKTEAQRKSYFDEQMAYASSPQEMAVHAQLQKIFSSYTGTVFKDLKRTTKEAVRTETYYQLKTDLTLLKLEKAVSFLTSLNPKNSRRFTSDLMKLEAAEKASKEISASKGSLKEKDTLISEIASKALETELFQEIFSKLKTNQNLKEIEAHTITSPESAISSIHEYYMGLSEINTIAYNALLAEYIEVMEDYNALPSEVQKLEQGLKEYQDAVSHVSSVSLPVAMQFFRILNTFLIDEDQADKPQKWEQIYADKDRVAKELPNIIKEIEDQVAKDIDDELNDAMNEHLEGLKDLLKEAKSSSDPDWVKFHTKFTGIYKKHDLLIRETYPKGLERAEKIEIEPRKIQLTSLKKRLENYDSKFKGLALPDQQTSATQ